ncbi:hypothetical protein [Aneurinibacillus tyrosinisolvens]|uniref:hypothetical protein n=1 Tax=Aneurinibacillus tyrosinisolvens TaxID=1443435 RepID=UPI00063F4BA9|nr:hypothetical protein [Aneurinibacillus tyrosinisolvens]
MSNTGNKKNELNKTLINEVKQKLLDSSFEMEKKPEGTIHFFVRNGLVQMRYEEEEINIVQQGQVNEQPELQRVGVSLKGVSNLIRLVGNALGSVKHKIDYGDIIINYSVQEDGTNFDNVTAKIVRHYHYARQ